METLERPSASDRLFAAEAWVEETAKAGQRVSSLNPTDVTESQMTVGQFSS